MSEAEVVVEDMSVDWRGRPCKPTKHGGMRAAVFVLGLSSLSRSCLFISYFAPYSYDLECISYFAHLFALSMYVCTTICYYINCEYGNT